MSATTADRVVVELELLPDGNWYATLIVGGLHKAGSGRTATPEAALEMLNPNLRWLIEERA